MSAADWDRISLNFELTEEEFVEFRCPRGFPYFKFWVGIAIALFVLLVPLFAYGRPGRLTDVIPRALSLSPFFGLLLTLEWWLVRDILVPAMLTRRFRTLEGDITRCYLFSEEKMTEIYAGRANSFTWESFRSWSEREKFVVVDVGQGKVPVPKRVIEPDQLVKLRTLLEAKLGPKA